MKKLKLSIDENDALTRLFLSDDYKALELVMSSIAEDFKARVMSYHLSNGPEGLVIEKARAEGVNSFIHAFDQYRNEYVRRVNESR